MRGQQGINYFHWPEGEYIKILGGTMLLNRKRCHGERNIDTIRDKFKIQFLLSNIIFASANKVGKINFKKQNIFSKNKSYASLLLN